jgi:hypothetical protein
MLVNSIKHQNVIDDHSEKKCFLREIFVYTKQKHVLLKSSLVFSFFTVSNKSFFCFR